MAVLQGCRTLPLFFCLEKLTLNDKVDIDVCLQMLVNGSLEKSTKHRKERMITEIKLQ